MFAQWYDSQSRTSMEWLHELHRHPEIGFEAHRTPAFVADRLTELGCDVATGIGGVGVIGTLRGERPDASASGRRLAFRAELDALPMRETADVAYRSEHDMRFHGCGHDGHMVAALTAAAFRSRHRDFPGAVRFVFQPAEELLTGARAIEPRRVCRRLTFVSYAAMGSVSRAA